MTAFRVSVNGKVIATAGIAGGHVLSAIVNSVAGLRRSGKTSKDLWMHLGGLVSGDRERVRKHVGWLPKGRKILKVGDKVVVEIVDVDDPDEPIEERSADPVPLRGKVRRRWATRVVKHLP